MALQWRWKEKCGEITMVQTYPDEEDHKYKISLYKGNAYLIMLHEYEKTPGTEAYEVFGFFNDKQHMRACLGLEKKRGYTSNIYETPYQRFTKLRINKARYKHTQELVSAFAEAFRDIQIEVYTEEEPENEE